MAVRKPDDLPRSYLDKYWRNWWNFLTARRGDETLRDRCNGCGVKGVLGRDLIHRGTPPRRTNLLCADCCEE